MKLFFVFVDSRRRIVVFTEAMRLKGRGLFDSNWFKNNLYYYFFYLPLYLQGQCFLSLPVV